jgi:23S rRNA (adenine2503-C2)-methyltransferase
MTDLYDLDDAQLADFVASTGQPAFRTRQLKAWLYERPATSFDAMSNLPATWRHTLATEARLRTLELDTEQIASDGTIKRLHRLPDGQRIESVLMKYDDGRRTACISSQAGCAMGCVFCATGQMGFARHLSTGEILQQVVQFVGELQSQGERLSNVVLMGMGEPFHNYDAVLAAIRRLIGDIGIGARHITVSTVGLVPRIRQFAQEGLQVKLAISLHAATDEERSKLLPANRRYPLRELMDACRYYADTTGRRISFEWALIAGRNDSAHQAEQLSRLFRGVPCHVNLIPLNPTARYDGQATAGDAAKAFVATLEAHGIPATIRVRRGIDIDAGCGQLKANVERKQTIDP